MARNRDYKAEYERRIARGLARGLSRSQARGHPKAGERFIEPSPKGTVPDPKLEVAFKRLRSGESLTQAAKSAHVSRERFRRYVAAKGLARLEGRRWVITDERPRKVATLTKGRQRELTVPTLQEASIAGAYWDAAGRFVRSNELDILDPFQGRGISDARGRFHPFETDPNELHRLAAMDAPAFHEVYEIISP
jgi:hypothetical protein